VIVWLLDSTPILGMQLHSFNLTFSLVLERISPAKAYAFVEVTHSWIAVQSDF